VPQPKPGSVTSSVDLNEHRALREEKIVALRLIIAYLFAVKRHLRAEHGTDHPDYDGLLPEYLSRFDYETSNAHEHTGPMESPVVMSGNVTPHPTRLRGISTSQTVDVDQRTPLLKDQHHIVHFHPCVMYSSCMHILDLTACTALNRRMLSPCRSCSVHSLTLKHVHSLYS
jgi:hypothetical protein